VKTPEELLEELELVSEGSSFPVHLFVTFQDNSIILNLYHATKALPDGSVIYEREPNFLSLLKDAIANGGVPVGWYRLKSKKTAGDTVELGVLQDQQKEPRAYKYLMDLFASTDKEGGTRFYIVYPDGGVLDITDNMEAERGDAGNGDTESPQ
jgi:hypothetical protein